MQGPFPGSTVPSATNAARPSALIAAKTHHELAGGHSAAVSAQLRQPPVRPVGGKPGRLTLRFAEAHVPPRRQLVCKALRATGSGQSQDQGRDESRASN